MTSPRSDYISLAHPGVAGLHLPYCFVHLDTTKAIWLPLDRNYKPLGVSRQEWVEYDEFVERACWFTSDPRRWVGCLETSGPSEEYLFLRSAHTPASEYFARLTRALSHQQHEIDSMEVFKFHRTRVRKALKDGHWPDLILEALGESPMGHKNSLRYWCAELAHNAEARQKVLALAEQRRRESAK